MKTKILILLMLVSAFVWACNDISEKDSNGDYVRLYFTSEATRASLSDTNGDGNLLFSWEKSDAGSKDHKELLLLVSNGSELIPSWDYSVLAHIHGSTSFHMKMMPDMQISKQPDTIRKLT